MGTASGSDYTFLRSYEFFRTYNDPSTGFRSRLIALAKESFSDLKSFSKIVPPGAEVALALEIDLKGSDIFKDLIVELCKRISFPNPDDKYWPDFFAPPVARFLVDNEWDAIVS